MTLIVHGYADIRRSQAVQIKASKVALKLIYLV